MTTIVYMQLYKWGEERLGFVILQLLVSRVRDPKAQTALIAVDANAYADTQSKLTGI